MEVSKIRPASVPAAATNKEVKSKDAVLNSNEGRNRKKLIAAALGGLAVAGVAALAIYKHKKVPSKLGIEEFKKIGKFDKGFATAKGKPFSGKITVPNKDGKTVMEYTKGQIISSTRFENGGTNGILGISQIPVSQKVYSQKDGARIVEQYRYDKLKGGFRAEPFRKTVISENGTTFEYNTFWGKMQSKVTKQPDGSILSTREIGELSEVSPGAWHKKTINTKTGEVLDDRLMFVKGKFQSEPVIRKTKDGITTINGKVHAIRTEKFDVNGNKIINVNYGNDGFKEITITPEGTRTVIDETRRVFKL